MKTLNCVPMILALYAFSPLVADELTTDNPSFEMHYRIIPHDSYYFLCRGINRSDQAIRLSQVVTPFNDANTISLYEMAHNRPSGGSLGACNSWPPDGFPPQLEIAPSSQYLLHISTNYYEMNFGSLYSGYYQTSWFFDIGGSSNVYVGFPDKDGSIRPPVVDRPLRYHTRKHQIALAFIFNKDTPRELGFLVMNKQDTPFVAVRPLSARSRIIARAPAIDYTRELVIPDTEIQKHIVASGEIAEWRLLWLTVFDLIPADEQNHIIAAGGDLDLVWKIDDLESPVLPMHIAPPETFKDSVIAPHPDLIDVVIVSTD